MTSIVTSDRRGEYYDALYYYCEEGEIRPLCIDRYDVVKYRDYYGEEQIDLELVGYFVINRV